jgi:hypothetical protein
MYNGNLTIAECGRSGKTINKNSERIISFERKNRKHKIFQLIFPPQRERERVKYRARIFNRSYPISTRRLN